jgi:hypothetical protein
MASKRTKQSDAQKRAVVRSRSLRLAVERRAARKKFIFGRPLTSTHRLHTGRRSDTLCVETRPKRRDTIQRRTLSAQNADANVI